MNDLEMAVDLCLGIGQRPLVSQSAAEGNRDEEALVGAARDGDRAAFERLYREHSRMVHGILLARAPRAEVDDLVQDVFLLAMRRLATLREAASFGPWIAAIARNRANDYHRRAPETVELPPDLPSERSTDAEAVWVLETIKTLPEAYRETLILRLVEGMTGPEISGRTGLTPGSVRVNLHRGMQQLREKLARGSQEGAKGSREGTRGSREGTGDSREEEENE